MDPNSGRLYESVDLAKAAGVTNPVELIGRAEDVQRVSAAVKSAHKAERKRARASRRRNR